MKTNMITAQNIIDECDNFYYSNKKIRSELNLSWIINDIKKQFGESN